MDLELKGRAALVAAASRGLGRACALAFAREGADVAICARGEQALRTTEKEIAMTGVRVMATVADMSVAADCERFVAQAAEVLGRVDVLVTNSGGPPAGPADSFEDAAYQEALEGNFLSAVRLCRAALPHMRRGGWGRILNITSIAAKQPIDGLVLSNSARAAVVGFAKTLANELASEGITVNTLCPGPTLTDRIESLARQRAERSGTSVEEELRAQERDVPMGRLGRPEEFAALVAFLASEQAAFITGATIQIDGGVIRSLM